MVAQSTIVVNMTALISGKARMRGSFGFRVPKPVVRQRYYLVSFFFSAASNWGLTLLAHRSKLKLLTLSLVSAPGLSCSFFSILVFI